MKNSTFAAALAAILCTGAIAAVPAQAQVFSFSFDAGDVAFVYRDGYWDKAHRWHAWRNAAETRAYREAYRHRYFPYPRHYYRDMGWRDNDRDGIPNRYDGHPNNPYRP